MKISFCVGRSAPPDSTSEIVGRPFSSAIWAARKPFFTVHGLLAPPFTVGSLAVIMHSTPSTTPMPVTTLAPTVKSDPHPARGESSRKAEPSSTSSSIRSRGSSLPRPWWRATDFSPPPATAFACSVSRSASFSSMASRFVIGPLRWLRRDEVPSRDPVSQESASIEPASRLAGFRDGCCATSSTNGGGSRRVPQQLGGQVGQHLGRSSSDRQDPGVAVVPLDLGPVHVSRPAVQLDGLVADVRRGVARGLLREAGLGDDVLTGGMTPRDLTRVGARDLDLPAHLDELVAHHLPADQRLAEGLAVAAVRRRQLERTGRDPVGVHGECEPLDDE